MMRVTGQRWILGLLATAAGLLMASKVRRRVQLSRAKHRSLAGHARMARRAARLVPNYAFTDEEFFAADGAPPATIDSRRAGFGQLATLYRERFAKTAAYTAAIADGIPD